MSDSVYYFELCAYICVCNLGLMHFFYVCVCVCLKLCLIIYEKGKKQCSLTYKSIICYKYSMLLFKYVWSVIHRERERTGESDS